MTMCVRVCPRAFVQALEAELEPLRATFAEVEAQLAELKASFHEVCRVGVRVPCVVAPWCPPPLSPPPPLVISHA